MRWVALWMALGSGCGLPGACASRGEIVREDGGVSRKAPKPSAPEASSAVRTFSAETQREAEQGLEVLGSVEAWLQEWVKAINKKSKASISGFYRAEGFAGVAAVDGTGKDTSRLESWIQERYLKHTKSRFLIFDVWASRRRASESIELQVSLGRREDQREFGTVLVMQLAPVPPGGSYRVTAERYLHPWSQTRPVIADSELVPSLVIAPLSRLELHLIWVPSVLSADEPDIPYEKIALILHHEGGYEATYLEDYQVPLHVQSFHEPEPHIPKPALSLGGFYAGLAVNYRIYRKMESLVIERQVFGETEPPEGEPDDMIWLPFARVSTRQSPSMPIRYSNASPKTQPGLRTIRPMTDLEDWMIRSLPAP